VSRLILACPLEAEVEVADEEGVGVRQIHEGEEGEEEAIKLVEGQASLVDCSHPMARHHEVQELHSRTDFPDSLRRKRR
jgi:hypothetical protein